MSLFWRSALALTNILAAKRRYARKHKSSPEKHTAALAEDSVPTLSLT